MYCTISQQRVSEYTPNHNVLPKTSFKLRKRNFSSCWRPVLFNRPHPKAGTTWRPCRDYRGLNALTLPDRYAIPLIHDFSHNLQEKTIFTSLDLVKAYYQIAVHEADRPKTAIKAPLGLFEFNRMPFDLRNVTQTFQRFLN